MIILYTYGERERERERYRHYTCMPTYLTISDWGVGGAWGLPNEGPSTILH